MFGCVKDENKKINTKGIGLGLVISKLIVEKFGGSIGFKSKYQHGSTFTFTFEVLDFDKDEFLIQKKFKENQKIKQFKKSSKELQMPNI